MRADEISTVSAVPDWFPNTGRHILEIRIYYIIHKTKLAIYISCTVQRIKSVTE